MVEPTTSRPEVEADDFVGLIDNPFLPLLPGSVWVYQGEDTFDIVRVTDDTKQILGVGTTVVFDVAYSEGEIVEVTFDWFAQDEDGKRRTRHRHAGESPSRRHLRAGECARHR